MTENNFYISKYLLEHKPWLPIAKIIYIYFCRLAEDGDSSPRTADEIGKALNIKSMVLLTKSLRSFQKADIIGCIDSEDHKKRRYYLKSVCIESLVAIPRDAIFYLDLSPIKRLLYILLSYRETLSRAVACKYAGILKTSWENVNECMEILMKRGYILIDGRSNVKYTMRKTVKIKIRDKM